MASADNFLGEAESAEFQRFSIGDGSDGTHKMLEGVYRHTIEEWDAKNGKPRFLHAIELREPIAGVTSCLVWGNHALDKNLPTLKAGTKVRLTYKGERKLDKGHRMKEIDIQVPKGTERIPNPFMKQTTPSASEAQASLDFP